MDSKLSLRFDVQLSNVKMLKSGSLTCLYEHGKLRYIRCNGSEIVRMIYTAVRDADWNTAPYHIINESVVQHDNGFDIHYTADYRMNDISYKADIAVTARENQITFSMSGEAMSDFRKNRIGICLLHPVPSIANKEVAVTKPSGETYTRSFPELISPHQPVKDIREMTWDAGVATIRVTFEGDIFETEDQRNWSDSSFKTYSTPLDMPSPVDVKKGDRISQQLQLFAGSIKEPATNNVRQTALERRPFPKVGFSKSPGQALSSQQIDRLKEIWFDHYRVELDLEGEMWIDELRTAFDEARHLDVKLHVVAFFGEEADVQLNKLIEALTNNDHTVYSLLVVEKIGGKSGNAYHKRYERIKQQFPSVKVGYGTNNHFADLNRNLPANVPYDLVSFGLTPQAHSTDTISLLENLDTQSHIINTIRTHLGNVEIHVSPVTFKGRKPKLFAESDAPADYDERQHTEFGAAWVLKTLRNLAGTSVTLFDAVGYKGIVNEEHAHGGFASPLYNIFKTLKDLQPRYVLAGGQDEERTIEIENEQGERFRIDLDPLYEAYRSFKL